MSEKHPTDNSTALIIGGEVKTIGQMVMGKMFVFTPLQLQFLLALQKTKNVMAASLAVDKSEEWGQNFLKSPKFRSYLNKRMEEFSVKSGLTIEWWYQFGKWSADGYKEFYEVECLYCQYHGEMNTYEVESYRGDDMALEVPCPACFKPLKTVYQHEDFKPSREQVEAWKDLGARLIPKIERVHHQFENVDIVFESEEEKRG